MQLVVDAGNTKIKLAVFKEDKLLERQEVVLDHITAALPILISKFAITKAIIASVGNLVWLDVNDLGHAMPIIMTLVFGEK